MATFSDPTFSSTNYSSFRPRYRDSLYTDFLIPYHHGPRETLLDLGCGPGIVTRPLSRFFTSVIGTDPSAVMLSSARTDTPTAEYPNITYRQASAEDLPFLADASVDMVVVGQAAHWFDHPRWWREMARVVRPGGTIAAWGYRDWIFTEYPKASVLVRKYSADQDKMGACWSQPGRSYVDDRLRVLRPSEAEWEDVLRWEWDPVFKAPATEEEKKGALRPVQGDDGKEGFGKLVKTDEPLMVQRLRLKDVENYWRTWSEFSGECREVLDKANCVSRLLACLEGKTSSA